jgi:hypothetical protein
MSEPLPLFHGTTLQAAQQIRAEGWGARDLTGMVGELATRHEVPVADVIDDLRRYNRFMLIEKNRGQVASLTLDYETAAGSWAQRAPEVEWDALWAIWRIKHSGKTEMYHWNLDVPGHAWVLEQMAHQKLAVVEVALTVDELFELGARVGGFAHGPLTPELVPLLPGLSEVTLPLPFQPSIEVILHQLERRVGWDVFAHWLGLTSEEFIAHDDAGRFGPAGKGEFAVRPWWPLSAVDTVLERIDAGILVDQL